MTDTSRYLTFDYGAESGRAVLGTIANDKLTLHEVHRFANEPQWLLDHFHWDIVRLFAEMKHGLAKCVREHGPALDGIGVDTWGVDFALLDAHGEMLGMPYHYRDSRTDGMMEKAFSIVPREELYGDTGIQFMKFNSLFQLFALKQSDPQLLDSARTLLFLPDLLNYWLTGRKANEFSIATTSQCYNPISGDWARSVIERLGIPTSIFGEIVEPGTELGPLHESMTRESGADAAMVIAPACHDTGSAVAAVPAEGRKGWAYISCGTWSLIGIESAIPLITPQTLEFNLTNEGGVGHTFRVLQNVMGLWLLQRCRRSWERDGRAYAYGELAEMADGAPAFAAQLNPDDDTFMNPIDMPTAIREYCARTGQSAPDDVATMVRSIIESLAMKYRWVIERLEIVTGEKIDTIHIIGGGCQNRQLCQATADASGRRVLAGPIEATAAGNIIAQALGTGRIASLDEGRALIRRSFPMEEYAPRNPGAWDAPYARFCKLLR